jgi:hypothetical protein
MRQRGEESVVFYLRWNLWSPYLSEAESDIQKSNSSKIFLPDGIFSHQFYTYGPSGMLNSFREQQRAIESDSRRKGFREILREFKRH